MAVKLTMKILIPNAMQKLKIPFIYQELHIHVIKTRLFKDLYTNMYIHLATDG